MINNVVIKEWIFTFCRRSNFGVGLELGRDLKFIGKKIQGVFKKIKEWGFKFSVKKINTMLILLKEITENEVILELSKQKFEML